MQSYDNEKDFSVDTANPEIWVVNKKSNGHAGIVEVGEYLDKRQAEQTAISLKNRDQSGQHSYVVELSKKTLGRYINKSADSLARHADKIRQAKGVRDSLDRVTNSNEIDYDTKNKIRDMAHDTYNKAFDKHARKAGNRERGIGKAVKRLTRETRYEQKARIEAEQADMVAELTKKTLKAYVRKAGDDRERKATDQGYTIGASRGDEPGDHYKRELKNRRRGMRRAVDRISKK